MKFSNKSMNKLFPELRCNNNYGIELIKALIDGDINNFKLNCLRIFILYL
ncbi:hypothetical protein DOY81_012819, partial [Sarcophaga bullata]